MNGYVRTGKHAARQLSGLSAEQLIELYEFYQSDDVVRASARSLFGPHLSRLAR